MIPATNAITSRSATTIRSPLRIPGLRADLGEDAVQEADGVVLRHMLRVHELRGQDALHLAVHLLLPGGEALLVVAQSQVADHIRDLKNVARLDLVPVVPYPAVPVDRHPGGVIAKDTEELLHHTLGDDRPDAGLLGAVHRHHDGHVVAYDTDGIEPAQLPPEVVFHYSPDVPRPVPRLENGVPDRAHH